MPSREAFRWFVPALWIELAIVAAWVGLFVHSQLRMTRTVESSSVGLELLTAAGEGPGAEWISVYLEGRKIGCGLADTVKTSNGYRLQERTYLRLRAFDQNKEISTVMMAQTDLEHRLRSFDFMLSAPPASLKVHGNVQGLRMYLDITTGGDTRSQTVELDAPPEISLTFKDRLVARKPSVGDVLEVPYFDPTTLSQQTLRVEVLERGEAMVDGAKVGTLTLEASFHGMTSRSIVTEDGRTLEETNALGLTLKRESRDQAIRGGWDDSSPPVDIIALSAVPVAKPLNNARTLTFLNARLSGGGVEILLGSPEDGRPAGDVIVQVVGPDRWRSYQVPLIDDRFGEWLEASALLQKDDPKIARVAQSIIGDVTDADDVAAMLSAWVHDRLRKQPVMGVPSALEVLETGVGDCNEHTVLFTALARSMGIPTRMAAGIVYSEEVGGGPAFYYHAWPEVYLGEWVAIDPTFGQFPADATHIKLVEGNLDDQLALLRVVGNLKVEILESR